MKPWTTLETAETPDGKSLVLAVRDGEYFIHVNGNVLMSSRLHHSEEAMAEPLKVLHKRQTCRVLIGGLGMGYTLRAVLDVLPQGAEVVVAELFEPVVNWNRGVLSPLAGHPLQDPRVKVVTRDVAEVLRAGAKAFDAILLDVDNGPAAFTTASNARLYTPGGGELIRSALNPDGPGLIVVWSADADSQGIPLKGFTQERRLVRGRPDKRGPTHALHIARWNY